MQKHTTRGRRSSDTVPLPMLFCSPLLGPAALGWGGWDLGLGLDATSLWWWWDYVKRTGLAGLGAEAHHQRTEVIRHSSPPHAVSVPFTMRDSTGIGRAGPRTWSGCYLTLVVVGLRISMLGGRSGDSCGFAPDSCSQHLVWRKRCWINCRWTQRLLSYLKGHAVDSL